MGVWREPPQPYRAFAAWYRSGLLTAGALLVLGALISHTEPGHSETFLDVPEIARMTHASVSKTRRGIRQLKQRLAVTQTQRGSRYRLSGWRINDPPPPAQAG